MNTDASLTPDFDREMERQLAAGEFVFPTFPDVVFRIRSALMDQRCSAEKLCKIVSTEPVLSAHILRTANSAAFNPTGRQISELPQAVTRLGFFMVRNIAYAVGYKQLILKHLSREVLDDLKRVWHQALEVGSAAYVVGLRSETNPHESFLAGLMHNVGEGYVRYAAGQHPDFYHDHAQVDWAIGKWHARMGAAILKNWGLAEETRNAIAELDNPGTPQPGTPMDFILRAAIALMAGERDEAMAERLQEAFLHLGIPETDAAYLRRQAESELEGILAALG